MKSLFVSSICILIFLVEPGISQPPETEVKRGYGYAFAAPGVVAGEGSSSATLTFGGGGEGLLTHWLGISADIGYLFFPRNGFSEGFGLFSPGVFYQFNRNHKVVPFVTGGYSLAFRQGTENLIHFGGGVNYWFSNHFGMRFEGRDHIDPRYGNENWLQFRVGFLMR